MELWRGFMEDQASETFENLGDVLADQAEFARFARQVIADFGYGDQLGDDPDARDDEAENDAADDGEDDQDQSGEDDQDDPGDAEADPEQSQDDSMDAAEAQVSMDELADQDDADQAQMPEGEAPMEPPPPAPHSDADPNYQVYLIDFDEEIAAEDLAEPAELERLRAYLDQQLEPLKGAVSRLANKLQRRLQAQQNRSWEFDREEAFWTPGGWPEWWPTRPRRCRSRSRKTPSFATRW